MDMSESSVSLGFRYRCGNERHASDELVDVALQVLCAGGIGGGNERRAACEAKSPFRHVVGGCDGL